MKLINLQANVNLLTITPIPSALIHYIIRITLIITSKLKKRVDPNQIVLLLILGKLVQIRHISIQGAISQSVLAITLISTSWFN